MKIELFNRDGANMWLEKSQNLGNNLGLWELHVDKKHEYCLKYIRIIGDYPYNIDAVDPSGGPYISVGNKFEGKYEIVEILNCTMFKILEYGNN